MAEVSIARESGVNPINAINSSGVNNAVGNAMRTQIPRYESELNRLQGQLERLQTARSQVNGSFSERAVSLDGEIERTRRQIQQVRGFLSFAGR